MAISSRKTDRIKKASSHKGTWVVVIFVLTVELFAFTWSRVQCTTTGYAITHEQEVYNELVSIRKKLTIERAHLKSPDRISNIAKKRLDLDTPDQNQILTLR